MFLGEFAQQQCIVGTVREPLVKETLLRTNDSKPLTGCDRLGTANAPAAVAAVQPAIMTSHTSQRSCLCFQTLTHTKKKRKQTFGGSKFFDSCCTNYSDLEKDTAESAKNVHTLVTSWGRRPRVTPTGCRGTGLFSYRRTIATFSFITALEKSY